MQFIGVDLPDGTQRVSQQRPAELEHFIFTRGKGRAREPGRNDSSVCLVDGAKVIRQQADLFQLAACLANRAARFSEVEGLLDRWYSIDREGVWGEEAVDTVNRRA